MNSTIHIKGIKSNSNENILSIFKNYGEIKEFNRSKNDFSITFKEYEDAKKSLLENGKIINEERLRIIFTEDKEDLSFFHKQFFFFSFWQWFTIILIAIISFLTHFPNLQHPNNVVFDETHFGGFITDYINGICFFDIHPPLAKLILAFYSKMVGYKGDFNFSSTESTYPNDFYIKIRKLPAFLGSISSPLLTASLFLRFYSIPTSFLCGLLFALDFTSIVQSRLILTDSILYFFVILTIFFSSLLYRVQNWTIIILQALSCASAFSCKFTAGGTLIFVGFVHLHLVSKTRHWFLTLIIRGLVIGLIVLLFLWTTIYVHIKMLPNEGFGDRYLRSDFRKLHILEQIPELLYQMYRYNRDLTATHPYSSQWYEWPLFISIPTLIWMKWPTNLLFIFNNPISTFSSLIGGLAAFSSNSYIYFFGYIASYLPLILVKRCMWSYHYEIPLIFGIVGFSSFIERFSKKKRIIFSIIFSILTIISYLFWYPWIYGTFLSFDDQKYRFIWPKLKTMWNIE